MGRRPKDIEFDPERRFWSHVQVPDKDGCLLWVGSTTTEKQPYGRFWYNGKCVLPHRWIYERLVGHIPENQELDHLCRKTLCMNVLHLEPISHGDNIRRGISGLVNGARQRSITHCPRGHPYSLENTYVRKSGRRSCRTCQKWYWGTGQ